MERTEGYSSNNERFRLFSMLGYRMPHHGALVPTVSSTLTEQASCSCLKPTIRFECHRPLLHEITTLIFCGVAHNISEREKISPLRFLPINTMPISMKANPSSEKKNLQLILSFYSLQDSAVDTLGSLKMHQRGPSVEEKTRGRSEHEISVSLHDDSIK